MKDIKTLHSYIPKQIGIDEMKVSAVCMPLIKTEQGYDVLFEVRSKKIIHQPGDVCFPGGMAEVGEAPETAAIREMTEELCVNKDQIEIITGLDYALTGKVAIYPFLVLLKDYTGSYSFDEVDHVFTVPLSYFEAHEPDIHVVESKVILDESFPFDKIYGGKNYQWRKRKEKIYFYEYKEHVIWGLTAKILHAALKVIR